MSTYLFSLYSVELRSKDGKLLEKAEKFAEYAEIADYNPDRGTVTLQFVSTADEEQVERLCEEFQKETESSDGTSLVYTYQIKRTML